MTVTSARPPLSRWLAGPDRRRSRAQLRQHRIRPRLSLASEPFSRGRERRRVAAAREGVACRRGRLAADARGRAPGSRRGSPGDRRSRFATRSTISAWRSGIAPNRPKPRSPASPPFMRDVSPRPSSRPALRRVAGSGACALRRSKRRWVRSRSPRSGCSPKAILHRIRECGGHACGWLFYDRSKNNRRRWCEMEVCGNRAKQRRLAARRREA